MGWGLLQNKDENSRSDVNGLTIDPEFGTRASKNRRVCPMVEVLRWSGGVNRVAVDGVEMEQEHNVTQPRLI